MSPTSKQDVVTFPEVPAARLRWRCDPESLPFVEHR